MAGTVVCPHCGRVLHSSVAYRHIDICPKNPDVKKRLVAFFHRTAANGIIIPTSNYERERKKSSVKLPILHLIITTFGTWDAVAQWAGLKPTSARFDISEKLSALRADLHRIAHELYGGVYGPSYTEFNQFRDMYVLSGPQVKSHFGSWSEALAWAGLPEGSYEFYKEQRKRRRERAERESQRAYDPRPDYKFVPEGLPCVPVWREIRQWDHIHKTYVVVGTQKVFMLK